MSPERHDPARRVFVYGTLRRGCRNHHLLRRARYLGRHRTPPAYTLFDTGPYPAVVTGGRTRVVGEVYAVDGRTFRALDRLEDYPRSYTRRRIDTPYGPAWIYLWRLRIDPDWPALAGDWRRREIVGTP